MSKTDKEWWELFRENLRGTVDQFEYTKICEMHAHYFNHKIIYVSKCASCGFVQKYINDLNEFYSNNLKN